MSKTVQFCSLAYLSEKGKILTTDKPETEDNISLLLSVFYSLNNLCEKLNKLIHVIQRNKLEQRIYVEQGEKE